jgi:hypothetical protein
MKIRTMPCVALIVIAHAAAPLRSHAQAYCALRNPVRQVYEMFPEATSYRSIVRTVDDRARDDVAEQLPFEMHYNELGRHTLYVPVDGEIPLGVVHVRSEASGWGLVEIAWAFDTDLRILDFRFQRCRDPKRSVLESDTFRTQIKGKDYAQLRAALRKDAAVLVSDGFNVPHEAEELAQVVVRSALKTMVVTESVWAKDLRTIRLLARSYGAFPNTANVKLIETPYRASVVHELHQQLGTDSSAIDRETVDVVRLLDERESTIGFVVRTDWVPDGSPRVLWWTVSPDGRIADVKMGSGMFNRTTKRAMNSLVGATTDRLVGCATAAELAALEVLVVCREQTQTE